MSFGLTRDELANKHLTPSEQEQILRVLRDQCPHNRGWEFASHGHNSNAYRCNLCGYVDFY